MTEPAPQRFASTASPTTFSIGGRTVGPGHPCFIIAEVGQAHDGSLGTAHAYIDLAARVGVDAVKFQTHIAAAESTPAEPWRVKFSPQDDTRYQYWQRMEFSASQWAGLAEHCADVGVEFLSSAFSLEAVELLAELGMGAWKIASGELSNDEMISQMIRTGAPLLVSSGMSPLSEIDTVVQAARSGDVPIAVFQCTSTYPCPPESLGLNVLAEFADRWAVPVGLSDHSGTIYPSLAAATLGASLLEVHIAFSPDCFGPDVTSSLTGTQLAQLVEGVRMIEAALANPVDKDAAAETMAPMRKLFTKSIVAARALPAGTRLVRSDLLARKPGTGIPAAEMDGIVGRELRTGVAAFDLLRLQDLK